VIDAAWKSDVGQVRRVNEDRAALVVDEGGTVLAVVADGMGGHQAGEVASQIAVETVVREMRALLSASLDELGEALREAVLRANDAVFAHARAHPACEGMGTTVVAAIARVEGGVVAHVGDSRAYQLTGGRMVCLTEDHSLVNELVKHGHLSPEEAEHHPQRHVLTQALGTDSGVRVDVARFTWQGGDALLLCSDGLSSLVAEDDLSAILASAATASEAVDRLVSRANEAGGDDNITVVVLRNKGENRGEAR
jgi:Serine/threonine protein phosphatase